MSPKLRLLLPLAALSLVAAIPTTGRDADALTFKSVAKRADKIVAEIAAQTGLPLATTDDAKLHVLIVSVTDVDVEALLERIATVTSSKWETVGEKRTLLPDEAKRRQEQSEQNAKRVAEFKKAQDKFRERLANKPEIDPETGEEFTYEIFETPAEKALAELALLIDPNEVARLSDDGRIVFSTAPNRMQRRMPSARATQILNALVADHNTWAAEQLKREADQAQDILGDPEMAAYYEMFMARMKPKLFEGAPAKAILVIEMEGTFFGFPSGSPAVKLNVYDQKGVAVISSELQMGGGWMDTIEVSPEEMGEDEETKETITDEQQQKIKPEDRVLVEFSEKSKVFLAMETMGPTSFTIPEPLIELLRDPTNNDPLSFHHSDMLHAIAKAKKLDVVANLSDTDMFESIGLGAAEGGVSVGQAYSTLTEDGSSTVVEKDGWVLVSPSDPVRSRRLRQDRDALQRFVDSASRDGAASLDTLATFALASPSPMQNGTSMMYLIAFSPQVVQGIMGETMDWPTLRFYGSLLPPQKAALRSGGKLAFGQLSQQARGVLTNMAFSSSARIKSAAKMKEQSQLPSFMQMMGGLMGGMFGQGDTDFTEEPTEVMPNGLPGDGFVELALNNEPIVRPEGGNTNFLFAFGSLGADELAMFELMKESPQGGEMAEFFPSPKQVKVGNRERLNFTFWLSPVAGLTKALTDDTVKKDAPVVPFSELPAELRALIEQRKKAIKESPFGKMMMSGIGG